MNGLITYETLNASDRQRVTAALGWLDLGNPKEAEVEVNNITPAWHGHPQVLKVRWCIHAATGRWEMAVEIGRRLRQVMPSDSFGWIQEAEALRQLDRTEEAWNVLLSAMCLFPHESVIAYHLASYSARLDRLGEAKVRLEKAIELDGSPEARMRALDDPDLEPLWRNIGAL